MRIAVDAMGGDHAPMATVQGALLYVSRHPGTRVLLVGDRSRISGELERQPRWRDFVSRTEIVDAADSIGMGESPVEALRRKKDTSIRRAAELCRDGDADALVSAGNTGATVAAATLLWKTLRGVRRPGIAAMIPTPRNVSLIIDVGANIQCKPIHLLQYGVMAAAYYQTVHGNPAPRVGLLNIGEEDQKGNELVRSTSRMLRESNLRFIGFVEGQELPRGNCEVFVTDGFVGNMILKVCEGVGVGMLGWIKREFGGGKEGPALLGRLKKWVFRRSMRRMSRLVDYSAYGGAPLLGVEGVCIIAHGRSDPKAIANAIDVAVRCKQREVNQHMIQGIRLHGEARTPSAEVN